MGIESCLDKMFRFYNQLSELACWDDLNRYIVIAIFWQQFENLTVDWFLQRPPERQPELVGGGITNVFHPLVMFPGTRSVIRGLLMHSRRSNGQQRGFVACSDILSPGSCHPPTANTDDKPGSRTLQPDRFYTTMQIGGTAVGFSTQRPV